MHLTLEIKAHMPGQPRLLPWLAERWAQSPTCPLGLTALLCLTCLHGLAWGCVMVYNICELG